MNISQDTPDILKKFLIYTETVRGKSDSTTDEYYLDIRMFMRFLKKHRGLVSESTDFDSIDISDVDIGLIRTVTLPDLYDFSFFLSREREYIRTDGQKGKHVGLGDAARARKVSSLKSFFKYLTSKAMLLDENPAAELEYPKLAKKLPRYLSANESMELLENVSGRSPERDYLIITLFLNCGLRVSELVGINLGDIKDNTLRVTGKGNKQRVVFLNSACIDALDDYLPVRAKYALPGENALFLSERKQRIAAITVKKLIKKHIESAGLDSEKYSAHKLRHTAATLMYQNGVDVLTLKEILGHEQLNTTQIYTHLAPSELQLAAEANPLSKVKRTKKEKEK
ncbi:MAG: tyrosine recombinase XerC [Clostridia bacterium]|nr:tyrosine recombinase XerC [Clostridia bacterium]